MKIIIDAMGGDQAPSEIVKGAIDASIENDDLDRFDTIIMGIRAFNLHNELKSKNVLLFDYAKRGGNLLIQYNTTRNLLTSKLTPFYLNLSRDRVTEEDSTVKILNPLHRALNFPHKITSEDFENWLKKTILRCGPFDDRRDYDRRCLSRRIARCESQCQ